MKNRIPVTTNIPINEIIIKYSGGLIKTDLQVFYFILALTIICIGVSFVLISSGDEKTLPSDFKGSFFKNAKR